MTDNITLPRAVGKKLGELLAVRENIDRWWQDNDYAALAALAALATALAKPDATREPVHPNYVIGAHWLETAYSRIAAGEAEADVLAEVLGERGWVKREPATETQVTKAYIAEGSDGWWSDYQAGWREAERFHGIRKENGK